MNNLCSLEGKVIIVTGGYGHLGKSIVENLRENSALVCVLGREKKKFENVFQGIALEKLLFFECDISQDDSVKKAILGVIQKFKQIDGLINNAYFMEGYGAMPKTSEFSYGLEGTLTSVYRLIKETIPFMEEKSKGSVVNIASMYGMVSPDFKVYEKSSNYLSPPNYGAAKSGVIQITKYFSHLLGLKGIRVNCVSPGPFPSLEVQKDKSFINKLSGKTALGRIGDPQELGGIISFLCSDQASYITGQNIAVDGGWTSR